MTNEKDLFEIKIHSRGKYKFIVYVSDTTAGRLLEELIRIYFYRNVFRRNQLFLRNV